MIESSLLPMFQHLHQVISQHLTNIQSETTNLKTQASKPKFYTFLLVGEMIELSGVVRIYNAGK